MSNEYCLPINLRIEPRAQRTLRFCIIALWVAAMPPLFAAFGALAGWAIAPAAIGLWRILHQQHHARDAFRLQATANGGWLLHRASGAQSSSPPSSHSASDAQSSSRTASHTSSDPSSRTAQTELEKIVLLDFIDARGFVLLLATTPNGARFRLIVRAREQRRELHRLRVWLAAQPLGEQVDLA